MTDKSFEIGSGAEARIGAQVIELRPKPRSVIPLMANLCERIVNHTKAPRSVDLKNIEIACDLIDEIKFPTRNSQEYASRTVGEIREILRIIPKSEERAVAALLSAISHMALSLWEMTGEWACGVLSSEELIPLQL